MEQPALFVDLTSVIDIVDEDLTFCLINEEDYPKSTDPQSLTIGFANELLNIQTRMRVVGQEGYFVLQSLLVQFCAFLQKFERPFVKVDCPGFRHP